MEASDELTAPSLTDALRGRSLFDMRQPSVARRGLPDSPRGRRDSRFARRIHPDKMGIKQWVSLVTLGESNRCRLTKPCRRV